MASKANRRPAGGTKPAAPTPHPDSGRLASLWIWLAALTAAAIVFSPAIDGTFIFDDFHLPFTDPNAAAMPARFWIGDVRPLLMTTYWANYLVSGSHPFSYHVVNIVLHATAATLVYFLLRKLLVISAVGINHHPQWIAMFGAGLFLLHPLQTESVDYIAGRSEVLLRSLCVVCMAPVSESL